MSEAHAIQPGTPERPNILWICTDQQRVDTLGCYGNPHVRTPNLDRLAEQSVLFERVFAQNSLSQPSRGSFLTGRYPSTNRSTRNGQACPADLSQHLITKQLDEEGYLCGLVGKLHLNRCDERLALGEEWWKYDQSYWWRGIEQRIDDGYTEFHWDHAPGSHFRSSSYQQWLHAKTGGSVPESSPRDDCDYVSNGPPAELHQTTWCAETAISFIERHQDQPYPWLLSVNIFDPHPHFNPPAEYLERYLDKLDEIPLPNYVEGELDDKPAYQKRQHEQSKWSQMSERDFRMVRAAYYAMVDLIDEQVGRVLDALDRTGQAERTVVIFMSDHGELVWDHGVLPKGPFLYDCSIQVPLMIRWPGRIAGGRRASGLVELTDLVPTLNEMVGRDQGPGVQGRSLWPLLSGAAPLDRFRDDIYSEFPHSHGRDVVYMNLVRTDRYKLINHRGSEPGELYDLEEDPGENRNRWADPDYAAVKTELLKRLCDRMSETVDETMPRLGVY